MKGGNTKYLVSAIIWTLISKLALGIIIFAVET